MRCSRKWSTGWAHGINVLKMILQANIFFVFSPSKLFEVLNICIRSASEVFFSVPFSCPFVLAGWLAWLLAWLLACLLASLFPCYLVSLLASHVEQVTRIVRITVAGNVFFLVRAACELTVGLSLYRYYKREWKFAFTSSFFLFFFRCAWTVRRFILFLFLLSPV